MLFSTTTIKHTAWSPAHTHTHTHTHTHAHARTHKHRHISGSVLPLTSHCLTVTVSVTLTLCRYRLNNISTYKNKKNNTFFPTSVKMLDCLIDCLHLCVPLCPFLNLSRPCSPSSCVVPFTLHPSSHPLPCCSLSPDAELHTVCRCGCFGGRLLCHSICRGYQQGTKV